MRVKISVPRKGQASEVGVAPKEKIENFKKKISAAARKHVTDALPSQMPFPSVRSWYTCVRPVVLQQDISLSSETICRLEVNEILEGLCVPRSADVSQSVTVSRILVRATRTAMEGWVTLVGTQGSVYVQLCENRLDDLQRRNNELDQELKKERQAKKKTGKDKEDMKAVRQAQSMLEQQVQVLTSQNKICVLKLGQLEASILSRSSSHHAKFQVKTLDLSTPMAAYFSALVKDSCVKHRTNSGSDTWEPAPILEVLRVEAVFNPRLQSKYELELNEIQGKLQKLSGIIATIPEAQRNKIIPSGPFDADCQEYFLLHGAPKGKTEQIVTGGLDPRRGGESAGRLFGLASYLAVNASKADLYTDANKKEPETLPHDVRQIIVFRTACGDYHRVFAPVKDLTLPPDNFLGKPMDSVVAETKKNGGCVDHVEIMIYRESQMLPAAVVSYRHVPTCTCAYCLRRTKAH